MMNIQDLQGKLVAILGYGLEGRATSQYLLKHGVKPVLFDSKPWQDWSQEDQEAIKKTGLNFIFGQDYLKELAGFSVIFRSPGIRLADITPHISQGCLVTSQTKYFFEHFNGTTIGVTGTKGKGTTSTLIAKTLRVQYPNNAVHLVGNIGQTQIFEVLDELSPQDIVVYELSSFQLQDLNNSPHIGVVLMVTSEHLDYHATTNEYQEAKSAIVKFQKSSDFAVINYDYPASQEIGKQSPGSQLFFSRKTILDKGAWVDDSHIKFCGLAGETFSIPIKSLQLPGAHNYENICAAMIAARVAGAEPQTIINTVTSFTGLEHRLEFVAKKNGVSYYNDSFSTTPETAIAAIESFSQPEIVILGGSSKQSDFSILGNAIVQNPHVKGLILIGSEQEKILAAISQAGKFLGPVLQGATSMQEIIMQVQSFAREGDVVLLSPACASFGMFANYKDRGQQFKQAVTMLP